MTEQQLVDRFLRKPGYLGKGSGYVAKVLNVSREAVKTAKLKAKALLNGDKEATTSNYIADLEEEVSRITHHRTDHTTGDQELTIESSKPLQPDELEKLAGVDNIKTFLRETWLKSHKNGLWTYSIKVRYDQQKIDETNFREEFKQFLLTFSPSPVIQRQPNPGEEFKPRISFLLPKQDAHYNKQDIYGNNNIQKRFKTVYDSTDIFLRKAEATNYLEEVIYVVGSDQFNAEWTGLTTKGTPQQSLLSYQGAFQIICDHEISVIHMLLQRADMVKVIFIPGNHDEYVGWHLIDKLATYFRLNEQISFNTSIENTKYVQYGNTAIMLNHGDVLKPKDLAQRFPIGFKEGWSSCKHFVIITGDKHHELSLDIQGIKFYQVPQLSSATSKWDDKNGYGANGENTAFVITQQKGISDILKDIL